MRPSKYLSSINTGAMILATLLDNKEYAQYDMPKAIKKDYRTVLRHLRVLEEYKMIRLVRKEPAKKGGKEKKIFGLTVFGLLQALKFEFSDKGIEVERIDEIAKEYSDFLPLIFGKWGLFRKSRMRHLVFNRFTSSLHHLPDKLSTLSPKTVSHLHETLKPPSGKKRLSYGTKSFHEDFVKAFPEMIRAEEAAETKGVYHRVFFEPANGLEDPNLQLRLFSVLKKDKDLTEYVNVEFERIERLHFNYLQNIRASKQYWVSMK